MGRDEVLVSAVTHPDMVRIISEHGLRAVPVDIDPWTLTPRSCVLEAAFTPHAGSGAPLRWTHGSRWVAKFARSAACSSSRTARQAFKGPKRMGDPGGCLHVQYSTLKTSTALGGAILRVRDREVLDRMRWIQASYPSQGRGGYLKKLLKVLGLVTVSRPGLYGLLARACRRLGSDLDALVSGVVRGFPPREPATMFLWRLRHRPSAPLLAMLSRRLRTFDGERLARRASTGERFARRLRVVDLHPGQRSLQRTHWLFPVVVEDAEALIASLRRRGLDASQATSSIAVVEAPAGRTSPSEASLMMSGVVFLPVYPELLRKPSTLWQG